MRIFVTMKAKLNLTIDESLLARIKTYSEEKKVSISELVERYFTSLDKPAREHNIIEMVEKLKPAKFDVNVDLKNKYYEDQAGKYGV
jgi:hypothetical protein